MSFGRKGDARFFGFQLAKRWRPRSFGIIGT
jgi:hypothetical protein